MQRTRRTAGKPGGGGGTPLSQTQTDCMLCVCFRRRQAKLQKELADAAKEPLPVDPSV